MPVPASINDLSTTAGSNSPAGSESPATLDDYQRAHASFIAQLRDLVADLDDDKQPLDAMLTALAALTSANGQFLAFTAADAPAARAIVGTVSQSSGTPTGSIIERGSSAAGGYIKFADGTMICTRDDFGGNTTTSAAGSIFVNTTDVVWTFPVAFVARPTGSASPLATSRWCTGVCATTNMTIRQFSGTSSGTSVNVQAYAIGRWF